MENLETQNMTLNEDALEFAVLIGERLLANGCGTHRIEAVIDRILDASNVPNNEIMVTTTGIVVTVMGDWGTRTVVKQVPKKKMNTERIALLEDVVSEYETGMLTASRALQEVKNIAERGTYSMQYTIVCYGLTGCFRAMMFGGNPIDGILSILIGTFMGWVVYSLNQKKQVTFLVNFMGGLTAGFLSTLFAMISVNLTADMMLLGSLMPIAPGVPFLHSTNDIMHGDYTAGITRAYEAILTGAAIGAGIVVARMLVSFAGGVV